MKELHIEGKINLDELKENKELVIVRFRDSIITKEVIEVLNSLNNLKMVVLEESEITCELDLPNITILSISECELNNLDFISKLTKLESLSIEYMDVDNLNFINNLNNLNYLSLTGSIIKDKIRLNKTNIEELHIDGIYYKDLKDIFFPEHLKVLYISKIQYLDNAEYYEEMKKYGVEVHFGIDVELFD